MKKKIYSALLAAFTMCLTSCSIDMEPGLAIDPETLGQDEVQQLLTGTYRILQSEPGRTTWALFDMRGENLVSTYLSSSQFTINQITESNSDLYTMWSGYYQGIYAANTTLATLENLEESELNSSIEAQARFLRAYAYYCLATRWDGVPILKENTLELVKRDSQDDVFDFIEEELNYCITSGDLASFSSSSDAPYVASLEAAKALKARLALAMNDMTTAATLSEELINSKTFTLSEDYDNIFTSSNNSEFIFAFTNSSTEDAINLYALFTTYSSPVTGSWFFCPSEEVKRMFVDENDTRNSTCISELVTTDYTYDLMNKFRDYSPLIVSRIAEMYLISAEAQGLDKGLSRLNELRVVRGLEPIYPSTEAEYQEAVALERRKELYCEGFLFYDLIRTGTVYDEVETISTGSDLYLPIPEAELTANPLLEYYN